MQNFRQIYDVVEEIQRSLACGAETRPVIKVTARFSTSFSAFESHCTYQNCFIQGLQCQVHFLTPFLNNMQLKQPSAGAQSLRICNLRLDFTWNDPVNQILACFIPQACYFLFKSVDLVYTTLHVV